MDRNQNYLLEGKLEKIHRETRHKIMENIYNTLGQDWKLEDIFKIKKIVFDYTKDAIIQAYNYGKIKKE